MKTILTMALTCLTLASCDNGDDSPSLSSVRAACHHTGGLRDSGKTLIMAQRGLGEINGSTFDDMTCVLGKLNTPDRVTEKISQTRGIDGRQDEQWGNTKASWTYGGDEGLVLILSQGE